MMAPSARHDTTDRIEDLLYFCRSSAPAEVYFDKHEENIEQARQLRIKANHRHNLTAQRKEIAHRKHRQAIRANKAEQRRQRARDRIRQAEQRQAEHAQ